MKISCNAKINLSLGITAKRDDGYHLIDSVMQSVSIRDELTVNAADEITVICSKKEYSGEKNIAYTAAKEFFAATNISGGAKIYIEKGIPDTAGMGGGSADAAAVITALDKIYGTQLSLEELCKIGLKVGADVPFCFIGGTVRVRGIGDILEPLPHLTDLYFVITKNGTKISTKDMYKKFDAIEKPFIPNTDLLIKGITENDINTIAYNIGNSFEEITGLYGIDEILGDTSPLAVSLSGSGPTVFGVYSDEESADKAFSILKSKGIEVYKAKPQNKCIFL
ncbi:MAG: 4-(cytidine 5'-diphospho)-2-C-methyl-D-erythritol kinase [Clostridia bacterium]|nr:4-(cytidine 5'-diphospho)-2-C-methyl-D-erythritol kinase [Clostridia bacterium]